MANFQCSPEYIPFPLSMVSAFTGMRTLYEAMCTRVQCEDRCSMGGEFPHTLCDLSHGMALYCQRFSTKYHKSTTFQERAYRGKRSLSECGNPSLVFKRAPDAQLR